MKSGFITIVGRPNVGKSTLMNKLVKEKVAIVSDKAGTTRDQIKGIVNIGENQFIFVDTPGIHKPKHLLGEHMTNVALEALENVDLIMFMLDGTQEISTGDMFVNENVRSVKTPIVLVINKIDKNYRIKKLKSALQNEREIDEVDTVLGKEELYKDLVERIHKIILGEFEYNKSNKDFIYKKEGYIFNKKNVATGIKSFGIMEILLKNKQLDENTILIIDEPEVHLHPKWQIKYAEILILNSKELGVKILLNSHSPYLIRAMEVYRKTYNYEDNIKFYTLIDCTEGKSKKIIDVTNNLNQIFDKLIEPYEILRKVDERYSDDE